MYACMHVRMYVCMCMYVRRYVCRYVSRAGAIIMSTRQPRGTQRSEGSNTKPLPVYTHYYYYYCYYYNYLF